MPINVPNRREVWTGQDAIVDVYLDDGEGNRVSGGPILSYCYWQDFSINAQMEQQRRPVTGRSKLKITNRAYTYDAQVSHFYFRKSEEIRLTDVFNREQAIQFEVTLDKPHYSGTAPFEADAHTLKIAKNSNWRITGDENDILVATANFAAEEFE